MQKMADEAMKRDDLQVTRLAEMWVQDGTDLNTCIGRAGLRIIHFFGRNGNIKMIERLAGLGAEVNATDHNKMTPLHFAMTFESRKTPEEVIELINCLARLGANINAKNSEGKTPLHMAVIHGKGKYPEEKLIEVIDCLVEWRADVNARFDENVTQLHRAISTNDIQVVKILAYSGRELAQDKLTGVSLLIIAIRDQQKKIAKHLVDLGADVHATFDYVPPLHTAVKTGNLEIVQILLKHGADIHSFGCKHNSLVNFAMQMKSDLDTFTLLAGLGADFNLPCTFLCAIHEAVASEKLDIVNCLMKHEINIATPTPLINNWPPIMTAICKDHEFDLDRLQHLVQCGAKINARYDGQMTTLELAVRKRNEEIIAAVVAGTGQETDTVIPCGTTDITVLCGCYANSTSHAFANQNLWGLSNMKKTLQELMRLGADINVKYNSFSVLQNAVARGDTDMVKVLANLGADVNKKNGLAGQTILSNILSNKEKADTDGFTTTLTDMTDDIITTLVEAGADLNSGHDQVAPVHIAVEHSDTKMVQTLHSLGADLNKTQEKGIGMPIFLPGVDQLKYLLKFGAKPNSERIQGIEPLLEALRLGDTEMVQCLIDCGADKAIGTHYGRVNALNNAIVREDNDRLKVLIEAGAAVSTKIKKGNMYREYLDEKATRIAHDFGIHVPKQPFRSDTLIMKYITVCESTDMLQTLLSNGANRNDKQNVGVQRHENDTNIFSNLTSACQVGNLDIVRLLIIDGSDVNELDSNNKLPFEYLPLRTCVKYHTLHETRTAEKVIERVGHDFEPVLPRQSMEALLSTPGLGDVKSIPNCERIRDDFMMLLFNIGKEMALFSKVIGCGSAWEGTKVGLPDELDFLVEVAKLTTTEQNNIVCAKHDYCHYDDLDETSQSLTGNRGSKHFHTTISRGLLKGLEQRVTNNAEGFCVEMGYLQIRSIQPEIKDSNRKATSPLLVQWTGANREGHIYMSVDVVPGLHVENSWPKGGIKRTWLLSPEELRQHGYYLVPKPPHVRSDLAKQFTKDELRTLWKISFPHLETYHMQHLEKRVKDVYVLAKCLRDPDVCRIMITDEGSYPKKISKYVTSYMLKMTFFKNVEEFRCSDLSLGEMVCRVFDEVEEGLSEESIGHVGIPLYFMPKVSALAGHKLNLSKCARVAKIMKRFVHALYSRDCLNDPESTGDEAEVNIKERKPTSEYRCRETEIRDCQNDPDGVGDEEVVTSIVNQRKATSVYRCIEVAEPDDMPEKKLWDVAPRTSHLTDNTSAEKPNEDSCDVGTIHPGVMCDGCYGPVRGVRYTCHVCPDYDLCGKCKRQEKHPEHLMIALRRIEDRK
ncbi:uncharacterized protein LOC135499052 [Lineus longissimus]|uniref:uncharacterized protein LOC135499052 n=1 Tax=Lineus longissimus TaxID=88925 RepID=UPI00315C89E8